ncbi:MAG: aminopeptidase [Rhodobacteraceae bacterium GWF1_65_7]|nr:MAG: aminopeptidase [Rhodobacteraceae bacterium GWF1_65_7]
MPSHPISRGLTLALALAGAGGFWLMGLPLPFLFGPMAACLLAALAGAPLKGAGEVSTAARTILGVAVGASITPEVVHRLPQMAGSVALVPLYVAIIGLVGVPFFRRLGFDRPTAWYAAMPGGLQDMVAFGQEAGADVRALALIHVTRVLVIVTAAPLILTGLYGATLTGAIGAPLRDLPAAELALMAAAALIGWKGGAAIGLFGASILGPMILTAALSLAGLIHSRPPAEAIVFAQLFIGLGIGVQYVGVTLRELRQFVAAGLAYVAILAVLAALFTEAVTLPGLAAPAEGFLAFAPGGQAEMTVLARVAGADLGFVILHHLTRIVVVILGAPVAARLAGLRRPRD